MKFIVFFSIFFITNFTSAQQQGNHPRKRLTSLKAEDVHSTENCTISLFLFVNDEGKVVRIETVTKHTTTTDQKLIKEIIDLVKREITYEERPGSEVQKLAYKVTITGY